MAPESIATLDAARQIVITGPWSLRILVWCGLALGLAILALAWWERRRGHGLQAMVGAVLRLAALAVALWLLAEPTLQTTTRHQTVRSAALFVDDSMSMQTLDPAAANAGSLRWDLAIGRDASRADGDGVRAVDLCAAALSMADVQAQRLERAARAAHTPEQIEQLLRDVERWVGRADELAGDLASHPAVRDYESDVQYLQEQLERQTLPALQRVQNAIQQKTELAATEPADRLYELTAATTEGARHGRRLADLVAERTAKQPREQAQSASPEPPGARSAMLRQYLQTAEGQYLHRLEQQVAIARYRFDEVVEPIPTDKWDLLGTERERESAYGTDLAAALEQVGRDDAARSLAAAVLVSDGQHNAQRDPIALAPAAAGIPLLLVPIGESDPARDVILHSLQAPRAVIQNDTMLIEAVINAHDCLGESLQVSLLEGDQTLEQQTIQVHSPSFVTRLAMRRKADTLGLHAFKLQVEPLPEEQFTENNQIEFSVDVTEDKLRVLVMDRLPRWEYRYLVNLFKRDEHVEHDAILLSAAQLTAEIPDTAEEWARYRVTIIGDVGPDTLDEAQQRLIDDYVSRYGGTLVLIAGESMMPAAYEDQPLFSLVPAEPVQDSPDDRGGFQLYLTDEGREAAALDLTGEVPANDALWRELTQELPIYSLSLYSRPKPTSHILIAAMPRDSVIPSGPPERVFLTWQQYGRGRVVYLAAPATYLLRFRRGDIFHHRFWGQLLRWAIAREIGAGSRTVRLSTDKSHYEKGETIDITLQLNELNGVPSLDAVAEIQAQPEKQSEFTLKLDQDPDAPGTYRGKIEDPAAGVIGLRAGGETVRRLLQEEKIAGQVETAVVVDPARTRELSETRCNLPLLRQVAESADGAIISPLALQDVLERMDLGPLVSETVTQEPLWTRWSLLWIFAACLCADWIMRKWTGAA